MKVLADNPELSSLKAAVESTGLSKGLACGASENTIFAPTNAAFEALPAVPEGDDLENVLKLHVIPGVALKAADLQDGSQTVDTLLDGQKLEVTKETQPAVQAMQSTEGEDTDAEIIAVTVSGPGNDEAAEVVKPDLEGCSSIVHVIDEVLLPSA